MAARQDDLGLYDAAMENQITTTFHDITRVVFAPTELAFKRYIEKYGGQVRFPFASYHRTEGVQLDENRYNAAAHYFGVPMPDPQRTDNSFRPRVVPVTFQYQIDLWGERKTDINLWEKDWFLQMARCGSLLVDGLLPGVQAKADFTGVDLTDNSDLEQETDRGRIYRLTISLAVSGVIVEEAREGKVITKITTPIHVDEPFPQ